MNDDRVVSVRGLVKAYGNRKVVDGLDLDVAAGEIVGLIGANGAGKTTTVECVQGLRRPDAGALRVFGLDPLADAGRLRRLVGSQLQSSGLPDRLRVAEAVQLFSGGDGDGLLERFGLAGRRSSPFASLSGGERQRLFLVLAVVNRPRLVILDELTQGLDPAARRSVWAAIGELRGEGTTVLLVTHELDEAEELCDRVVAMRAGRVLDSGTPAELVDRHGRSTTITFTLPGGLQPGALAGLPGVGGVRVQAGRATVTGHRAAIAEVGALLVQAGPVPGDLAVRVPRLEDALVGLLEAADGPGDTEPQARRPEHELIGTTR
jgi:ABC-2 type transport system ATP-binding protein